MYVAKKVTSDENENRVDRCECIGSSIVLYALLNVRTFTTARVPIPAWACENVASDLGLGGCFRRVLWFSTLHATG